MRSKHNEGKSVVDKRFIIAFKYATSISKICLLIN